MDDDLNAELDNKRSQTPDPTMQSRNRRASGTESENKRRIKSAVATPPLTGGRRRSGSATPTRTAQQYQQQQQQQQQQQKVTFPIGQSPIALHRQKSYGEFKAELFTKLERAGVPVNRRPPSSASSERGRGGALGDSKTLRPKQQRTPSRRKSIATTIRLLIKGLAL